jgi:hypothetical protein
MKLSDFEKCEGGWLRRKTIISTVQSRTQCHKGWQKSKAIVLKESKNESPRKIGK